MNFVTIPFFGFSLAGSAGSAAFSYHEVFVRKWMPVNAVGFSAVDRRRTHPSKDVFFGSKDFEMLRINAGRRFANMVQMHSFRNWPKHQSMGVERLLVYLNLSVARSLHGPSPEPAPAIWLYLVFFFKHLLCISTFS